MVTFLRGAERRSGWVRALILTALAATITLFFPKQVLYDFAYEIGEITREEIVATVDFPIQKDPEQLAEERAEIIRAEPFAFARRPEVASSGLKQLDQLFSDLAELRRIHDGLLQRQQELFEARYTPDFERVAAVARADSAEQGARTKAFTQANPYPIFTPAWQQLLAGKQPDGSELDATLLHQQLSRICRDRWGEGILDIPKGQILSDEISVAAGPVADLTSPAAVHDLESAWSKSRKELAGAYPKSADIRREIGSAIVVELLKPNLLFDQDATERRQKNRLDKIPLYHGIVLKNERIVDANTRVTLETTRKLDSYRRELDRLRMIESRWAALLGWAGRFLLTILSVGLLFAFLRFERPALWFETKTFLLFAVLFLFTLGMTYGLVAVLHFPETVVPVAAAGMVCAMLYDSKTAVAATAALAVLEGLVLGNRLPAAFFTLTTGLAGIYSVRDLRTRVRLFASILPVAAAGGATIAGMAILRGQPFSSLAPDYLALAAGSVMTPLVAYGLGTLFEGLFGITSGLTLLELADFNHPLLKRLSQEANGTFNHSVVVGNLVEGCSAVVGANPLLGRVGAYYHDIGKLSRPEHFIENQSGGTNPHDTLSPEESARIIASHIADGLKLARAYRLPQTVADFIPMHHGTSRIEYFFQKALERKRPGEEVDERTFRHAGPKPNTKETGIVHICEAAEAAVRSLRRPTAALIEATVDFVLEKKIEDGQLSDCPLTFQDLSKIRGRADGKTGLIPMLIGLYHLRIEYPGQPAGGAGS